MKIDNYINELLYDHDCVIIADLGGFIAHHKDASVNSALHVISPPSRKIAFNSSLRQNDGLLATHIARESSVNYIDACGMIRDYVRNAMHQMNNGQRLKIEKVGVLYIDKEHNMQFVPDQHANYLAASYGMMPVHAPLIKRESHVTEVNYSQVTRRIKPARKFRKWKMIEVIPAAAILTFLFLMPPVLDNLNSNLSTMLPFSRINEYLDDIKGERSREPIKVYYPSPFETPPVTSTTPVENSVAASGEDASKPANPEIPVTADVPPVVVDKPVIAPAPPVTTPVASFNKRKWHVVGGSFRREANALKYMSELKAKGIDSELIGKNEAGFYIVSLFESGNYYQVMDALPEFRSNVIAGAWVYKK